MIHCFRQTMASHGVCSCLKMQIDRQIFNIETEPFKIPLQPSLKVDFLAPLAPTQSAQPAKKINYQSVFHNLVEFKWLRENGPIHFLMDAKDANGSRVKAFLFHESLVHKFKNWANLSSHSKWHSASRSPLVSYITQRFNLILTTWLRFTAKNGRAKVHLGISSYGCRHLAVNYSIRNELKGTNSCPY